MRTDESPGMSVSQPVFLAFSRMSVFMPRWGILKCPYFILSQVAPENLGADL